MWVIPYIVEGSSHFPMDMLRYDASYPSTSDDVVKISLKGPRVVKVCGTSGMKSWKPTADRWRSFGWQVIKVETPIKTGA